MEFFVVEYLKDLTLCGLCCFSRTSQSEYLGVSIEILSNSTARQPTKCGSKRIAYSFPDFPICSCERYRDIHYDITGVNAKQVVELLKAIVKKDLPLSTTQVKKIVTPTFYYLGIGPVPDNWRQFQKKYELSSNPRLQLSTWKDGEFIARPYDRAMVDDLEKCYNGDTRAFATQLERLFKDNTIIAQSHFVTSEVYMLLLLARCRQVIDSGMTTKKRLDESAVKNIMTLLKANKCTFTDVFLKGGQYHCFTGEAYVREEAIKEIDAAVIILEEQSQGQGDTDNLTDKFKKSTLKDQS